MKSIEYGTENQSVGGGGFVTNNLVVVSMSSNYFYFQVEGNLMYTVFV